MLAGFFAVIVQHQFQRIQQIGLRFLHRFSFRKDIGKLLEGAGEPALCGRLEYSSEIEFFR